jgi:hypothetical protein
MTEDRIWAAAAAVGTDAAANVSDKDIRETYRPVILFFTRMQTVAVGKKLKAAGYQPTKMWGRTCYVIPTPLYRTFEQAFAYADWCAEVLTAYGLDICYGVVREGEDVTDNAQQVFRSHFPHTVALIVKNER